MWTYLESILSGDDDDDDDELLRNVDQRKAFCFISSRDRCQKFSSQITRRKQDFNQRRTSSLVTVG